MPAEKFVLENFTTQENLLLKDVIKFASDASECYILNGIEKAQNQFNGTINL